MSTLTAVCQLPRHLTDGHPGPCHRPATSTAGVYCPNHGPARLPVCGYHRGTVTDGRRVVCGDCESVVTVWLLERMTPPQAAGLDVSRPSSPAPARTGPSPRGLADPRGTLSGFRAGPTTE